MFIYGALVANKTDEDREDIDALLNGQPLPSDLRAEAEQRANRQALVNAGLGGGE